MGRGRVWAGSSRLEMPDLRERLTGRWQRLATRTGEAWSVSGLGEVRGLQVGIWELLARLRRDLRRYAESGFVGIGRSWGGLATWTGEGAWGAGSSR